MLSLKENSWWKFLSEVFFHFLLQKGELNRAWSSSLRREFFQFSLCQYQSHDTLQPSNWRQAISLQATSAHVVLKLHENGLSWGEKEPFIRMRGGCFRVLGRATGSCLSYFDSCFIFGVEQITSRLWTSDKMKTPFFILGTTVCSSL